MPDDVLRYVTESTATPLQDAQEIMEGLFPTLSADSIQRYGRRTKKPKKQAPVISDKG